LPSKMGKSNSLEILEVCPSLHGDYSIRKKYIYPNLR
jgi:hypothetical protein